MARARRLGYGEGSVYPEESGWRGEIRVGGQRRRVTASSRAEATARLDELRIRAAAGLPIGDDTRLGPWLEWYKRTVVSKTHPNTQANYAWAFEHLRPLYGHRLRDLDVSDVEAVLMQLAGCQPGESGKKGRGGRRRPLGTSSLRRIRACLGAAINEAERRDLVGRNVARLAHLPLTIEQPKKKRALPPDQARRLLKAVFGDRNEALFWVAITLGLRPGEVLGLHWTAIDLSKGTLEVKESLQRLPTGKLIFGPPKKDSFRTLGLAPLVIAVLKRHLARQRTDKFAAQAWEDNNLVFPSSSGRPMDFSNLRRTVRTFCESAGIPVLSPNELRHSAGTLLVEAGTPLQEVADLLGHRDIRMLAQVYRHKLGGVIDLTDAQARMFG